MRIARAGTVLVLLFSLLAGCAESPTAPSQPEQFQNEITVEGQVTSGIDGSAFGGVLVRVGYWGSSSCHGIGCSAPWIVVAETETDPSGSYLLSFQTERCATDQSLQMRVSAPGDALWIFPFERLYKLATGTVNCREAPQHLDFTLEPMPPTFSVLLFATSLIDGQTVTVPLTAGHPARLKYSAWAEWELVWISIAWGDGSPVEVIPASGGYQTGEFTHTYDQPGQYTYEVIVTDSLGRSTTASVSTTIA